MAKVDPEQNYELTKKEIGYVPRKQATQKDYDRIGFMSGLEVHQQLLTEHKLFCRCPAGVFQKDEDYDAEVIRHMRPTLSELGEYDGTALMEFKTRKEITYKLNNNSACTYDIDDTPPFKIDREALDIALEISILSKFNIVGEVYITRKQYLDGSIPAGFQRTAILGVEGEIPFKDKTIRLIQLSIEEDSCREISDVKHSRVYKTDRLGMPLIETVTYPEMVNPDEVKEVCDYIRFLNRSTGKVRTGMGAGRQDVNVSCRGGERVEIKGVAHTKWIPELTHNECYRQWALLAIRDKLLKRISNPSKWKTEHAVLDWDVFQITYPPIKEAKDNGEKLIVVNLPNFKGMLSHFTQPGKTFSSEIEDRLKVIACLEKPNMLHTEQTVQIINETDLEIITSIVNLGENDAQIVFWAPDADVETAIETIEERCQLALVGIPNETRKSFEDGTTIFERVLPGADRMYPDTDSAPIPLNNDFIDELGNNLPIEVIDRYHQLKKWGVPEDTYTYIFSKNLMPIIEKIVDELGFNAKLIGSFFGHQLKFVEGHYNCPTSFDYNLVYELFKFIKETGLEVNIAAYMIAELYENPLMDFESILTTIKFKKKSKKQIIEPVELLKKKFSSKNKNLSEESKLNWIMGEIRDLAIGNYNLSELRKEIEKL
jgi:glutamyl-tRNA(Gln) amidotransferase subunit E